MQIINKGTQPIKLSTWYNWDKIVLAVNWIVEITEAKWEEMRRLRYDVKFSLRPTIASDFAWTWTWVSPVIHEFLANDFSTWKNTEWYYELTILDSSVWHWFIDYWYQIQIKEWWYYTDDAPTDDIKISNWIILQTLIKFDWRIIYTKIL